MCNDQWGSQTGRGHTGFTNKQLTHGRMLMMRHDVMLAAIVDSEEIDNINNSNCIIIIIIIISSSTATTSAGDTFVTPYDGQPPLQRDLVSHLGMDMIYSTTCHCCD